MRFYRLVSEISLLSILCSIEGVSQTGYVNFYPERDYQGTPLKVYYGSTGYPTTIPFFFGEPTLSWTIHGSGIACRVEITDKVSGTNGNPYPSMFIYSEDDEPGIFGTNQYAGRKALLQCVEAKLPEAPMYIPIDKKNIHPDADQPLSLVSGHCMLFLRRAFFWENSEDLESPHGPYGDIKVNICDTVILKITKKELRDDPGLWQLVRSDGMTLPGQVWGAAVSGLNPHSEWIDGMWGCFYTNIPVYDYDAEGAKDEIAVVISEADGTNPEDFLGYHRFSRAASTSQTVVMRATMFGWVSFQNLIVDGPEPPADAVDVYWYGGWDGRFPATNKGPGRNAAVPTEGSPGGQYVPFTDGQFWSFQNNSAFDGYTVGLLSGHFPEGVYNRRRTYYAIDKPAVFGQP